MVGGETVNASMWSLSKSTHDLGVLRVTRNTRSRWLYAPGCCGALTRIGVGMWRTSARYPLQAYRGVTGNVARLDA